MSEKNIDFLNWLKLHDYETDCAIPEECISYMQEAFEAGKKRKNKIKSIKQNKSENLLFDDIDCIDVNKLYTDMPEYDNHIQEKPLITATFKFASIEDFEDFKKKVSESCFNGEKVFDGMQKLDEKQSWYPHKMKASDYMYIDGDVK